MKDRSDSLQEDINNNFKNIRLQNDPIGSERSRNNKYKFSNIRKYSNDYNLTFKKSNEWKGTDDNFEKPYEKIRTGFFHAETKADPNMQDNEKYFFSTRRNKERPLYNYSIEDDECNGTETDFEDNFHKKTNNMGNESCVHNFYWTKIRKEKDRRTISDQDSIYFNHRNTFFSSVLWSVPNNNRVTGDSLFKNYENNSYASKFKIKDDLPKSNTMFSSCQSDSDIKEEKKMENFDEIKFKKASDQESCEIQEELTESFIISQKEPFLDKEINVPPKEFEKSDLKDETFEHEKINADSETDKINSNDVNPVVISEMQKSIKLDTNETDSRTEEIQKSIKLDTNEIDSRTEEIQKIIILDTNEIDIRTEEIKIDKINIKAKNNVSKKNNKRQKNERKTVNKAKSVNLKPVKTQKSYITKIKKYLRAAIYKNKLFLMLMIIIQTAFLKMQSVKSLIIKNKTNDMISLIEKVRIKRNLRRRTSAIFKRS